MSCLVGLDNEEESHVMEITDGETSVANTGEARAAVEYAAQFQGITVFDIICSQKYFLIIMSVSRKRGHTNETENKSEEINPPLKKMKVSKYDPLDLNYAVQIQSADGIQMV